MVTANTLYFALLMQSIRLGSRPFNKWDYYPRQLAEGRNLPTATIGGIVLPVGPGEIVEDLPFEMVRDERKPLFVFTTDKNNHIVA